MTRSSGQLVGDVRVEFTCDAVIDDDPDVVCGHSQIVDAQADYEHNTKTWECEQCGLQYADEIKRSR